MNICMFVYNNCTTDARVNKEARTLADAGHAVTVVAVLDATTEPHEERAGFEIVRIDRNPIHYRILNRSRATRRWLRLAVRRMRRLLRIVVRRSWFALRRVVRRSWFALRRVVRRARRLMGLVLRRVIGWAPVETEEAQPAPIKRQLRVQLPRWLTRRAAIVGLPFYALWRGIVAVVNWARGLPKRALLRFHKPLMFIDWYQRAYREVRERDVDALHAHDLITMPVAVWLARKKRVPLVYDSHELYPEVSTLSRLERIVWKLLERVLIRRADTVVTVCESIGRELQDRYGVAEPVIVLNCPPRSPAVRAHVSESPLRRSLGLNGVREPIVLYQGGFAPNRGLPALVEAASYLEHGIVVLMGWGKLTDELRELVTRLDLEGRVAFAPPVPANEVIAYAAGADVGVIPYEAVGLNNYYTTPNKLFDYMAAGIPIAGSRFPELVRFIEGLGIGVTFDPTEPRDVANALAALLADDAGRGAMCTRALAAAQRFVWEEEAVKLLDLYGRRPAAGGVRSLRESPPATRRAATP